DLAEQRCSVLSQMVPREPFGRHVERLPDDLLADSVRHAAVTECNVQIAVRAEFQSTAIVLTAGPVDLEQDALRTQIDSRKITWLCAELRHTAGVVPGLWRTRA